jgi:DNA-binding transcriptional regulator YiaG
MSLPHTRPDRPADNAASPAQAVCARAEVQRVRWLTGLSQDAFARTFAIDPDALRDVEAGRVRPDAILRARLRTIARAGAVAGA